ncbi:hypothetical protein L1887_15080 [Cichorium endivia]|nr:hypothetical protein L1887_15080 [Cichorium endivia]
MDGSSSKTEEIGVDCCSIVIIVPLHHHSVLYRYGFKIGEEIGMYGGWWGGLTVVVGLRFTPGRTWFLIAEEIGS